MEALLIIKRKKQIGVIKETTKAILLFLYICLFLSGSLTRRTYAYILGKVKEEMILEGEQVLEILGGNEKPSQPISSPFPPYIH